MRGPECSREVRCGPRAYAGWQRGTFGPGVSGLLFCDVVNNGDLRGSGCTALWHGVRTMGKHSRLAKSAVVALAAIAGMALAARPTGASDSYSGLILSLTPRAYWQLGELSGTTAFDSSPHHSNGIYQGGPLLGQPGPITGDPTTAAEFNGVGSQDVAWSPHSSYRGHFTILAWINTRGLTGKEEETFFDTRTPAAEYSFDFKLHQGNLKVDVGDGTKWLLGGGAGLPYNFTNNRWYQVAAVVWPDHVGLYVNGTWIGREYYPRGTPLLYDQSHKVYLGANARFSDESFYGLIGQVAIFLRPLRGATISKIYQTGVSP